MSPDATSNPIGPFRFRQLGAEPVQEPHPDVAKKQDASHTEGDFMKDLDKATRRKAAAS